MWPELDGHGLILHRHPNWGPSSTGTDSSSIGVSRSSPKRPTIQLTAHCIAMLVRASQSFVRRCSPVVLPQHSGRHILQAVTLDIRSMEVGQRKPEAHEAVEAVPRALGMVD